jgi:AraC family L-rhamnose operon transcriptional activator RhaR/AraC family L-rhamnose operon regulatory protein RhaS
MKTYHLNDFTQHMDFPLFIQYGQHEDNLSLHTHADFNELTIVLDGKATHVVNDEKYQIKKGDMFVIGDKIAHGYENPQEFKICNIMYRLKDLLRSDYDITKSVGFHALFVIEPYLKGKEHPLIQSKFTNRLQLSPSHFEVIYNMIANMIQEYNIKEEGWKTLLYANFLDLVVKISRTYNMEMENHDVALKIALPIAYIGNHFTEALSIVDLAKQANMSVRHFTRIFHNVYKSSPNAYIIQHRIQYSYSLLKNSDLTIADVAYKCGFNDSTYYTRQFKKLTGITPKQYRTMLNPSV